jgi:hypothetical protein
MEVGMSKLFCLSPGLRVLERQMQQPPGYKPRGYDICIIEEMDWKSRGNYSEIVDCVISRIQLEHLKKRVAEIFGEVDKELIFRSMKHRNDFYSLLMGKRSKTLQHTKLRKRLQERWLMQISRRLKKRLSADICVV